MQCFHQRKYMPNIIDDIDWQYLYVPCGAGVTYTNKIGDLPGYSNTVWCNPKGIYNILSLVLVQEHHIVTYKIQDGN